MNEGPVSDDELARFDASVVVLFSTFRLAETQAHVTCHTLQIQKPLFNDGDKLDQCDLRNYSVRECSLKGPKS